MVVGDDNFQGTAVDGDEASAESCNNHTENSVTNAGSVSHFKKCTIQECTACEQCLLHTQRSACI